MDSHELPADIADTVRRALAEDIGTGDLSAALVPAAVKAGAAVLCREQAILCGIKWFDEVFAQLDADIRVDWHRQDGEVLEPGQCVCELQGAARAMLSGERTALNFLQLLSGTATITRRHVEALGNSKTRLLDTRKTLPGLRSAQKYAVLCGGGMNHRLGLYDAILIKENHIRAAGGIAQAMAQVIATAKQTHRRVQVEVEDLSELEQAIAAGADGALLDNFSLEELRRAVALNGGRIRLEASGSVAAEQLVEIAATGIDYISVGGLTKHVRAVDFSLRIA